MTRDPNRGSASLMKRAKKKWSIVWTNYTMSRKKRKYRRRLDAPQRRVAFVVGCQRSGTNMLIQTLDRSLDVDRFDESNPRAFDDCRLKSKDVLDALCSRSDANCIIFKPICDSHRLTELLEQTPGSKAVWIYRRYRDVANSAVERWGDKTQRWLDDLLQGGGDWGTRQWNKEKITEACMKEVREASADGLSPHAAAVLFWYMRNRTYFEQKLEDDPRTMLTCYEHMVADPTPEVERVCRFLEVSFHPGVVRKVFSSSVQKRSFPETGPRITELCDGLLHRLDQVRAHAD